jgi:hypothetical protein
MELDIPASVLCMILGVVFMYKSLTSYPFAYELDIQNKAIIKQNYLI